MDDQMARYSGGSATLPDRSATLPDSSATQLPLELGVGDLRIDRGRRTVVCDGRRLRLRRRQFDLLVALAAEPGRVQSRADLLVATRSQANAPQTRTIDVQIGQLRDLLASCRVVIETVRGRGYRLVDNSPAQGGQSKQKFAPILPDIHRPLMAGL